MGNVCDASVLNSQMLGGINVDKTTSIHGIALGADRGVL